MVYNYRMIVVVESATFKKWVGSLQDRRAVGRINARIRNISLGNFGDSKPIANKVSEMRIHYGPGYRLYYTRKGDTVVVLLCGGVKGSQRRDIERAKRLADEWR